MFQGQLQSALRMLYPPVCVTCDAPVASDFGLCGSCLSEMPFVSGGICDRCGVPLAGLSEGEVDTCDACLELDRPWIQGRAVLLYEGCARTLVLQLKHSDRPDLARPAGLWLSRTARALVQADTLIVPVPMHRSRLLRRKYNQAVLLARQVGRHLDRPLCPDLLMRLRKTPMQDHRSRDERFANLEGAVALKGPRARSHRLAGRHVLLIDDVMTSGATLAACATACLDGGARRVDICALTRTPQDEFVTPFSAPGH